MAQVFTEEGQVVPVTILEMGPCKILQVKTSEKDGYSAVQVGFGKKKGNKASDKHGAGTSFLYLSEFIVEDPAQYKVGDEITVKNFEPGDVVDVIGVMKGRGFAGVMKRHGFHGFPKTHGHDKPRSVGSIGSMFPQHVRKGMRMAGRMGGNQVTSKNLIVVDIDPEKNLIWVTGSVPGSRQGLVKVESVGEKSSMTFKPAVYETEKPAEKIEEQAESKQATPEVPAEKSVDNKAEQPEKPETSKPEEKKEDVK